MFALLLVGFSLAPLGLLLLFWNMFPQDRSIHPVYREAGVETEVQYAPSSQLKTLKHELPAAAKVLKVGTVTGGDMAKLPNAIC